MSAVVPESPPDTRGPTAPYPLTVFGLGVAAIALVLGGTILLQLLYVVNGPGVTAQCREELSIDVAGEIKLVNGAKGVCHVVEALTSSAQTFLLVAGVVLGLAAILGGFGRFRQMSTRRMREQCLAGAILGIQAIALAGVIGWFRSGRIFTFARNFLNAEVLQGSMDGFIRGVKNTIILAFSGEVGGIMIGLLLAILALSTRRVVRAPARAYINFFRGTPLIWQLSFFYFFFTLGLSVKMDTFQVAIIVFCLNTGAYAAEVFRAGIQSIERGQMEAARSLGMTYLQAMRYAVVPQAVRRVIPPLMNEFVILIKDTSLIVALGLLAENLDIYNFSRQGYSDTGNATFFVAAAVGYLVVTLPLIRLVNMVEKRMHSGLTGIVG
jgi:polar amino acid transport system permease protein